MSPSGLNGRTTLHVHSPRPARLHVHSPHPLSASSQASRPLSTSILHVHSPHPFSTSTLRIQPGFTSTLHVHSPRPLSTSSQASRPLSTSTLHVHSPRPLSTSTLHVHSYVPQVSILSGPPFHPAAEQRIPLSVLPCCPEPSRSSAHVTVPPGRMPTISQTMASKGTPELQVLEPELPRLSNIPALQ